MNSKFEEVVRLLYVLFGPRFSGKKTCSLIMERSGIKRVKHITTESGFSHEYLSTVDRCIFREKALVDSITVLNGHDYAVDKSEVYEIKNKKTDKVYIAPTEKALKVISSMLPRDTYKIIYVYSTPEEINLRIRRTAKDDDVINAAEYIIKEDVDKKLYDGVRHADYCIINRNNRSTELKANLQHIYKSNNHCKKRSIINRFLSKGSN